MDGHSTYGHLKSFEWWFPSVPQLRAKFVLFYVGLNDLHSAAATDDDETFMTHGNRVIGLIQENSAMNNLIRTLAGTYRAMVLQEVMHASVDFARCEWVDRPLLTDHGAMMRPRLAIYADRLRSLAGKTRSLGARPIFVTQTSRRYKRIDGRLVGVSSSFALDGHVINGVDYAHLLGMLNEETMHMSGFEGGLAFNLEKEVEFTDDDFYDYSHLTPQGTAKVGHYLYEKMRGLL
jgi:hypothetical protein